VRHDCGSGPLTGRYGWRTVVGGGSGGLSGVEDLGFRDVATLRRQFRAWRAEWKAKRGARDVVRA
jgi:hypothetical protein